MINKPFVCKYCKSRFGEFKKEFDKEEDDWIHKNPMTCVNNLMKQVEILQTSDLTDAEVEQVDTVHNSIFTAVKNILGEDLTWDMEWIGEVADLVVGYICRKLNKDEHIIYPFRETEGLQNGKHE